MDLMEYIGKHFAWIIAFISLSWAVYQYVANTRRSRKAFTYRVSPEFPIVTKNSAVDESDFGHNIEVSYEGEPVERLFMAAVDFRNSGGQTISASDFVSPVRLGFAGGRVLRVETGEPSPKSLDPHVEVEGSDVVLKPVMMNPGDRFRVVVLVADKVDIVVTGRISGVRDIVSEAAKKRIPIEKALALHVVVQIVAIWLAGNYLGHAPPWSSRAPGYHAPPMSPASYVLFIILNLAFFGVIYWVERKAMRAVLERYGIR